MIGAGGVYLILFILNSIVPYCCICRTPFSSLRWILPFIASVGMPILAVTTFYRLKIKTPLSQLEEGTKKIMTNDLDFPITFRSKDELGQLCQSFDFMRLELLKSNQKLWQKVEERKRLNAAFAHDLRNPVTVLKGSASMLEKEIRKGDLNLENATESISLIAQYTKRIEGYIQVMTRVQKLEDVTLSPKEIEWSDLVRKLEYSLSILSANTKKKVEIINSNDGEHIYLDQDAFLNVAENLISNGLRYSKNSIKVLLSHDKEKVILKISDDGQGFSSTILNKGIAPFLRDTNSSTDQHFGMGLYICHLLCGKHGGGLTLDNHSTGAEVTATFYFEN
jgi:K+-sensing histidine kinase KdpD